MCGSVSTPSVGLGQPDTELPLRLGHWASYFVLTYSAAINPSSLCRAAFSILHGWPQHHLSNKVITLGSQPLRASVSHLWNETGLSIIPYLPVPVFYCCCGKWHEGLNNTSLLSYCAVGQKSNTGRAGLKSVSAEVLSGSSRGECIPLPFPASKGHSFPFWGSWSHPSIFKTSKWHLSNHFFHSQCSLWPQLEKVLRF